MDPRLKMWAFQIFYLMGLLFVLAVLSVLTLLGISVVRNLLWRRQRKRVAREDYREKHDADGRRLPDCQRGLCDECGRLADKVYFLPTGPKLCSDCYQQTHPTAARPVGNPQSVKDTP